MLGVKFAPIKPNVYKELPKVVFYNLGNCTATGGRYKVVNTLTGKCLAQADYSKSSKKGLYNCIINLFEAEKSLDDINFWETLFNFHETLKIESIQMAVKTDYAKLPFWTAIKERIKDIIKIY